MHKFFAVLLITPSLGLSNAPNFLPSPPSFRLVEEVKLRASTCQLQNEDVYMNTTFQDFIQMCVRKLRGEDDEEELVVDYVSVAEIRRTAVTD